MFNQSRRLGFLALHEQLPCRGKCLDLQNRTIYGIFGPVFTASAETNKYKKKCWFFSLLQKTIAEQNHACEYLIFIKTLQGHTRRIQIFCTCSSGKQIQNRPTFCLFWSPQLGKNTHILSTSKAGVSLFSLVQGLEGVENVSQPP